MVLQRRVILNRRGNNDGEITGWDKLTQLCGRTLSISRYIFRLIILLSRGRESLMKNITILEILIGGVSIKVGKNSEQFR